MRDGRHVHFKMNRKCAAGTGAFLEEIALRLDLPIGDLNGLAECGDEAVRLSSFCTVFAKTEILSHLRNGVPVGAIVRGAFSSVVNRVVEMDPLEGEIVMTRRRRRAQSGHRGHPVRAAGAEGHRAPQPAVRGRARGGPPGGPGSDHQRHRGDEHAGRSFQASRHRHHRRLEQSILDRLHRHQEPGGVRLQGAHLSDQPQGRTHPVLQGVQVDPRRARRDRPRQHLGQLQAGSRGDRGVRPEGRQVRHRPHGGIQGGRRRGHRARAGDGGAGAQVRHADLRSELAGRAELGSRDLGRTQTSPSCR